MNNILDDILVTEPIVCHKSKNVEIYQNPDVSRISNIIKSEMYEKVRIGVDSEGNIYGWIFDLGYDVIENIILKTFVVRFEYIKGNSILFLNQDITQSDFGKLDNNVLERLKGLFPAIRTIERMIAPFDTVYTYA